MRLEPVYLLAPEPRPTPRPPIGRRTLLLATMGSLGLGIVVGWTGAALMPAGRRESDTDESLRWALSLQEQSIENLLASVDAFLARVVTYDDPRLVVGVRRLTAVVLDESIEPNVPFASEGIRRDLALKLAAVIEGTSRASAELTQLLPALRAVR
jgi:hypothetical protein